MEEQASVGGLSGTNVTVTAHWALWVFFCALINCKTCSGKVWIWLVSGGMKSLFENIWGILKIGTIIILKDMTWKKLHEGIKMQKSNMALESIFKIYGEG